MGVNNVWGALPLVYLERYMAVYIYSLPIRSSGRPAKTRWTVDCLCRAARGHSYERDTVVLTAPIVVVVLWPIGDDRPSSIAVVHYRPMQ